jgi:glycogen debranching enzyme
MISLSGLTLVTGRYDIAASILSTFAKNCREGLILTDSLTAVPIAMHITLWMVPCGSSMLYGSIWNIPMTYKLSEKYGVLWKTSFSIIPGERSSV